MARAINLNCDMAEGFGAYDIGNDHALLKLIPTASIACGFHAGDPDVMHRVVMWAKEQGASIGAHPGFNDLQGFGRRQIQMKPAEIEHLVAYQIGALQAMACYAGLKVTHVKAHGALSNMACKDEAYAMAIAKAVRVVDRNLIFVAIHGTHLERAGNAAGLPIAREGFADRQYDDDGNLTSRAIAGSVIKDPKLAIEQTLSMVRDGEIISRTGKRLNVQIDTVCIHGDEPTAVPVATMVRQGLEAAGISVVPLDMMKLG